MDPTNLLTGKAAPGRRALFFEYQKQQAVREGWIKLLRRGRQQPWMLFDLEKDAGETRDLAVQNTTSLPLAAKFQEWRSQLP
jgi:arylsulfatase A-like enzyme